MRIERAAAPARTDALEAAARAVLCMLTSDEPSWQEALHAWDGARIRKVARRARGAAWERAAALPGITVVQGSASVRVFPPVPNDDWPPELGRLQVGGTELTDPSPPGPASRDDPLILLSPLVEMSAGKAMAQAGHAAQLGWRAASPAQRLRWAARDFALSVRTASPAGWQRALDLDVPVVQDGGFTEVAPGTRTALILL